MTEIAWLTAFVGWLATCVFWGLWRGDKSNADRYKALWEAEKKNRAERTHVAAVPVDPPPMRSFEGKIVCICHAPSTIEINGRLIAFYALTDVGEVHAAVKDGYYLIADRPRTETAPPSTAAKDSSP